jgi:hypothetical protein
MTQNSLGKIKVWRPGHGTVILPQQPAEVPIVPHVRPNANLIGYQVDY